MEKPMVLVTGLLGNLCRQGPMIYALAVRELRGRYVGTVGGFVWTIAHPLSVIAIFYIVFAVGFKSQGPRGTSFVLWFICGLAPWFFFSETLSAATNSIITHAYLIKKTIFPPEILPIVQIVAGLVPHFVFLVFVGGLLVWFQIPLATNRLLVVYFLLCTCILLVGLSWLLSAIQVFYRDVSHALSVVLNLCFWATPIVWSPDMLPEEYRSLIFLNPMSYVVEGYRGLLLFNDTVWPSLGQTTYFWCVVMATFLTGAYVFGRLKPEFADVM
jgi:lipopolysaccharide transport system permease protein/teichoic acid transport system permease protein